MIERSFDLSYLKTPLPDRPRAATLLPAAEEPASTVGDSEFVIENIQQALQGLQFGEITITVRNGTVVQIERIARKRQFKVQSRDR